MPSFETDFTPPASPTGLTLTAEIETSSIFLEWEATSLAGAFLEYRISRSIAGGPFVQIATIGVEAESFYRDFEAPLNAVLDYALVVVNTPELTESDPATGGSGLILDEWWLVDPGGEVARTFHLAYVIDWRSRSPLQAERFEPLGRSRVLTVRGQRLGEEGGVTVEAPPDHAGLWQLLKDAQLHPDEYVLLKSPFSEVFRVTLGDLERRRGGAGVQVIDVPFVEVG